MLSETYIPCQDSDCPLLVFEWAGFHTNTEQMCEAGWMFKCLHNKYTGRYLLRFWHPKLMMTFAIKFDSIGWLLAGNSVKTFKLDCIGIGGRYNHSPRFEKIKELTVEHVPDLLNMIDKLLEADRERHMKEAVLPEAEVIDIQSFLSKAS